MGPSVPHLTWGSPHSPEGKTASISASGTRVWVPVLALTGWVVLVVLDLSEPRFAYLGNGNRMAATIPGKGLFYMLVR